MEGLVLRFPSDVAGVFENARGSQLVLEGPVEVTAREVEGRLMGLLPVVMSGAVHRAVPVPALAVPWLELTDVRISDLALRAKRASMSRAALSATRR